MQGAEASEEGILKLQNKKAGERYSYLRRKLELIEKKDGTKARDN